MINFSFFWSMTHVIRSENIINAIKESSENYVYFFFKVMLSIKSPESTKFSSQLYSEASGRGEVQGEEARSRETVSPLEKGTRLWEEAL